MRDAPWPLPRRFEAVPAPRLSAPEHPPSCTRPRPRPGRPESGVMTPPNKPVLDPPPGPSSRKRRSLVNVKTAVLAAIRHGHRRARRGTDSSARSPGLGPVRIPRAFLHRIAPAPVDRRNKAMFRVSCPCVCELIKLRVNSVPRIELGLLLPPSQPNPRAEPPKPTLTQPHTPNHS